ncbi:MAG: multidrug resistance protein, MATE family [bacterium P3]|nr:MAG: multidrug resistance protein, MATE family [bacterium P3]KWW39053.1 MAG: multidrug resistance protein, MATE family [bacterium F083]
MNRRILQLALPNIVTNITVPLLGIVDMAIVGHLSAAHIGAITIGSSIFNLIYWNFGFLRMGTSGFTSQAYGAGRTDEVVRTLLRALAVGLMIAAALLALQWPIARAACVIFKGSAQVIQLAMTYFFIRIWAAPATLGLYAVKGWYIGMQNAKLPMWIAIFINVVNILCSLLFVAVLRWNIAGVALGTVIAQYSGLLLALALLHRRYGALFKEHADTLRANADSPSSARRALCREVFQPEALRQFFRVNGDIFLRTVCLAAVFSFITAVSGRISDEILAVDALLLQFFTVFSYFMDGFAYAGESLTGYFIGARENAKLRQSVRLLMLWGVVLTVAFSGIYALGGRHFLHIFSDDPAVIDATMPYMFWTLVVPVCGFAAFLLDGVYVGATASATMRNAMFVATAAFFGLYYGLCLLYPTRTAYMWNNFLWLSFMVYLTLRGLVQALRLRKAVYGKIHG